MADEKKKTKYTQQYDKKEMKIKDYIPVFAAVFVILAFYFIFFHKDKTPYGYADIPEKLDAYLKVSSQYSKSYNGDKMFVLYYAPNDKDNKYSKMFREAVETAARNKKVDELFDFVPFYIVKNNLLFEGKKGEDIIKNEKELKKVCRSFCMVNPKKKQVYFYYEPKVRDIQYLESNLEKLEFWGIKLD